MTTKNLPPVVTAGGPPTAAGGTILNVPAEAAVFDQEFLDNYDLDVEGDDDYTLSQKIVHYCGGIITPSHWIACKACLAFFAGAATSKMWTTTKALKEEASCLQVYLGAIDALNNSHFDMNTKAFFRHSLQKKDELMTGLAMYRYYQDTRSKALNQVLPFFPKDLVSMKNGRGFHESCNDVYINAYRKGLLKNTLKRKLTKCFHFPFGNTQEHLGTLVFLSRFFVVTHNWHCKLIFWLVTFFIVRSTIFSIHDCNIQDNRFFYNFKTTTKLVVVNKCFNAFFPLACKQCFISNRVHPAKVHVWIMNKVGVVIVVVVTHPHALKTVPSLIPELQSQYFF